LKIRYNLEAPAHTVAGVFRKGDVKDVPDEIAKQLLSCSGFESLEVSYHEKEIEEEETQEEETEEEVIE